MSFEELATILKSEEMNLHKGESSSANVFLATSKSGESSSMASTTGTGNHTSCVVPQHQGHVNSGYFQTQIPPIYQLVSGLGGQFYPQVYQQSNRNRDRGGRGPGYGNNQRASCPICGKSNHTAFYCHHRKNLGYQLAMNYGRPFNQQWSGNQSFPTHNSFGPMMGYNNFSGNQSNFGPMVGHNGMISPQNSFGQNSFGPNSFG